MTRERSTTTACTPTRSRATRRTRARAVRDPDAARPRGHDLREVQARPARVRGARARRARAPATSCCPSTCRRAEPPKLPEIAEPEIVRHYNRLSKRNFDLDTGFYPLGSCTMKHNPKLHERVAALPGNARLHPAQAPEARPGRAGADVGARSRRWARSPACRTSRCSRAPARTASSRACCSTRAYHEDRGEHRTQGPHPRHRARHEPGDGDDGRLRGRQGRHRRATAASTSTTCARRPTDDVACLMLTNPNTLGLFDENIDGDRRRSSTASARRSTTTGRTSTRSWAARARATWASTSSTTTCTRPSRSRTAAAARAPARSRCRTASSPTCRARRSSARAATTATGPSFDLDYDRPKSIGRLRGFQGNYGVFVRSYAYILLARRRRPAGGVARPRCSTPTTCSRGSRSRASPSTCRSPTTASACTSSCSRARR